MKKLSFKIQQFIAVISAFIIELFFDIGEAVLKIKKEIVVSFIIHILIFLALGFMLYNKTKTPDKTYTYMNVKLLKKEKKTEKKIKIPPKKAVKKKKKTRKKVIRKKKRNIKKRNKTKKSKKKPIKKKKKTVRKKLNPVKHTKKYVKKNIKNYKKKKILVASTSSFNKKKIIKHRNTSVAKKENMKPRIHRKMDFTKRLLVDAFDDNKKTAKKHFSLANKKLSRINSVKILNIDDKKVVQKSTLKKFNLLAIDDHSSKAIKKDNLIIQDDRIKKAGNITVLDDTSKKTKKIIIDNHNKYRKKFTPLIDSENSNDDNEKVKLNSDYVVDFSPIIKKSLTTGPYTDGLDKAPELIASAKLRYPEWAEKKGISGKIVVKLFIRAAGKINNVQVIEQTIGQKFSAYVLQNIRKWKFNPPLKNGKAVNAWVIQTINFSLN
ncbi:energy transducer TonB [bacterium]|nr:energy transducer TonB [bacterium]